MKKLLITLIGTNLFFSICFGQKKDCKYDKNEVDKFTKKAILLTDDKRLTGLMDPSAFAIGLVDGDKKYLGIKFITRRSLPDKPSKSDLDEAVIVPQGSKLIILMGDQSTIELKTESLFSGTSNYTAPGQSGNNTNKYDVYTTTIIYYPVDASTLKLLIQKEANSMRLQTKNGSLDYEYAKKKRDVIQEVMKCIE